MVTFNMSFLYKWFLRLMQYFNILYGFSYTYVDIEKRSMKFPKIVKMYVYFLNLVQCGFVLWYYGSALKDSLYFTQQNSVMHYVFIFEVSSRMILLLGNVILHIREEKFLKKSLEIFSPLQAEYFDKLAQIPSNKILETAEICNISIMLSYAIYYNYYVVCDLFYGRWINFMSSISDGFFKVLERYIMFKHSIMLYYISYCFSKLNKQLENRDVTKSFANIYYKLTLLLGQVNIVNSPIIFFTLFSQLLAFCTYMHMLVMVILSKNMYKYINFTDFIMRGLLIFSLFFYFLICECVYETINKTRDILTEYYSTGESNEEVDLF